jgi:hypothetical protein
MISPESQGGPNLGQITTICGWTFLTIDLFAVGMLLWSITLRRRCPDLSDCLIIFAFFLSIGLTVLTRWAIVDDGMDNHQAEIQKSKLTSVITVRAIGMLIYVLDFYLLTLSTVPVVERGFMGTSEHLCSFECYYVSSQGIRAQTDPQNYH